MTFCPHLGELILAPWAARYHTLSRWRESQRQVENVLFRASQILKAADIAPVFVQGECRNLHSLALDEQQKVGHVHAFTRLQQIKDFRRQRIDASIDQERLRRLFLKVDQLIAVHPRHAIGHLNLVLGHAQGRRRPGFGMEVQHLAHVARGQHVAIHDDGGHGGPFWQERQRAGGAQLFKEPEKGSKDINTERAEEALDTGAGIVATGCPFCMMMLRDGLKAMEKIDALAVLDIAEITARANLPDRS